VSDVPGGLLLGVALAGAVVAAFLVWVIQERARAAIRAELEAVRTVAAVAQSRLDDVERQRSQFAADLGVAVADARQLAVDKQGLATSLQEKEKSLADTSAALICEQLARQSAESSRTQFAADLGVARERLDGLSRAEAEAARRLAELDLERRALGDQVSQLSGSLAAAENERNGLRERLAAQEAWVLKTTEEFKAKVLAGAAQIMEDRGKAFTETNRREVETVVGPFKEKLEEFRRRVDDIYASDNKERGELKQQVLHLTALNQTVSQKTEQLTNALTVQSKSTGNWGETILARILEDSGLRRDREYRLQVPIKGPDGESLIPDAVIDLPEQRQLVVDSKVSNKAWSDYCAAGGDEYARAALLKLHLTSLRSHLRSLASKDYSQSPDLNTVDFVLMFVPVEAALLTALQEDDSLYSDAYRAKVILVTPSTLMAVVKLAEGLWTLQKRKESADQIAEAGRKLYEKLTNFAQTFMALGKTIDDSKKAFDQARGQLAKGKGNAIGLAEKMKDLGVTPGAGKGMPQTLLKTEEEWVSESGDDRQTGVLIEIEVEQDQTRSDAAKSSTDR
jgi:DNA recombination protein RmuC